MRERFRLIGVTVGNDGSTELRLACTQEVAYRWSFKGERVVELSEVTEPENDLEAGVRERFVPGVPERDIRKAIDVMVAFGLGGASLCGLRWSTFDEFVAWAATQKRTFGSVESTVPRG